MDLSVPCIRCGRPAAEHGEHHHPHRGMGGQGPKVAEHPRVPLCRGCHRDLHDGRFRLELNGPIAQCVAPDGAVLSVRAVRPQPLVHAFEAPAPDLAALAHQAVLLDDESLAYVWETGETWRGTGDVVQAIVAWAMRQRYGSFGDAWYRRAAEILSEYSGLRVSVGT
ncbi:MAG TPA: hypothetical protein VNM91_03785, partial [Dehalococcoidia bacterium]|nr:hypothetical protein [Dehalococcoidia bacterium]